MAVSAGLQKYFDGKRKKKGDINDQLENILADIDPRFLQSFIDFRERILDIVEEHPSSEDIIKSEIQDLESSLGNTRRKHDMKKASCIIEASENI